MKKRIALAFTLLTATCVAALTWLAYSNSKAALSDAVLRDARAALAAGVLRVEQVLDGVSKDVLILNGVAPLHGILRARHSGGYDVEAQSTYAMWVDRYQQMMIALLHNKLEYWQVRYIDELGQERVRVDSLDGRIQAVPESVLQNKAEYPYLTETLKLPPGGLYVSRLDLNRENGRIQVPYRPTLHVATPVFDVLNQRKGVIVINLHAAQLLNDVLGPLRELGGQGYLVDQDGYFLSHPDPDKTFGFDLDRDDRLLHLHPRLAARLGDADMFVEIADRAEITKAEAHVHGFRKIAYDPLDPRNYWAIVFEVPNTIALAPVARQRDLLLGLGLVITLAGTWAGFVWAGRISRPLDELSATANHIAGGHPEQRVDLAGKRDEIHALAVSFNHMVDALVAAERRLANILDTAGDAIISIDEDQRIVAYNRAAGEIFGHAPETVLGQPLDRLLPPDLAATHREHIRAFGHEPGLTRVMGGGREVAGRRADGTLFPAEASISKVIEEGHTVYTAILRDVTERMRAEAEVHTLNAQLETRVQERTAELAAVNKELEAFSYSVSHDLRAPLRSIDGFSQALLEDYQDRLDDPGRNYLQRVRAASQRMAALIDDMLGLSRVTRAPMQRETVDLSELAAAVVEELHQAHPQHAVEVAITPALVAEGDARLLRILLTNLLGNAWKFTGNTVNARIEFGAQQQDDDPVFYVRDNGAGFDMQHAHKLFGAFQRLHAMDEFPGTGIGLATVQRIVHRHGGSVRAEGAPGAGATFYFTLSRSDAGDAP